MPLLIWNDSIDFNDITDLMYEFSGAFFYIFQLYAENELSFWNQILFSLNL